ncbi:MAG: Uxx-star family glutaredoxin-like (seleno)protein [Candidatus Altiarchaeota archaeon]
MAEEIIVYSTPTCPYCRMAKEYLNGKNVKFREIDVAQDRKAAKEMIELSGQMGVPQIVIGEKVIVGFDRDEIDKALG